MLGFCLLFEAGRKVNTAIQAMLISHEFWLNINVLVAAFCIRLESLLPTILSRRKTSTRENIVVTVE